MRIAPADPPYRPELQAQFDKLMPAAAQTRSTVHGGNSQRTSWWS